MKSFTLLRRKTRSFLKSFWQEYDLPIILLLAWAFAVSGTVYLVAFVYAYFN